MQQVKNKKKGKAQRVSRIPGKYSRNRKPNRLPQAGRRKLLHGTRAITEQPLVAFALEPVQKEIPTITALNLQGETDGYITDENQLKLLEDIYPTIQKMKGFIEPIIDEKTTTADILKNILNQFERIGRFEQWSINLIDGKFKLRVKHVYGRGTACYIAADFLAKINKTHERLHEFLIYAFRLASQQSGVPLFYDWVKNEKGGTGQVYEWLFEKVDEEPEDPEDKEIIAQYDALEYYGPKGVPYKYAKLLQGPASLRIFEKKLAAFKPSNELEKIALPFLEATLAMAKTKFKMYDYCDEPYEAGRAKPYDYMQVIWTYDDDDPMAQTFHEWIDSMAHGCGVTGFCWDAILDDTKEQHKIEDFCDKVEAFFEAGQLMANEMNKQLEHVSEQSPEPLKKKRNGKRLINIL